MQLRLERFFINIESLIQSFIGNYLQKLGNFLNLD